MVSFDFCPIVGCVNQCKYCPQDKTVANYKSSIKMMSFETFKTCLNKIPKDIPIMFAGFSEPFQNPMTIHMVQYAYENGYLVKVLTTGIGLKEGDIKVLEGNPIRHIKEQGTTFEFHLPDNKGNTSIKVDEHYLKILKLIKDADIKNKGYILFGKMHPEVKKVLGFNVEDKSRNIQNRAGNLDCVPSQRLTGKIRCDIPSERLNNNVMLPNGDVYICYNDFGLKHKIGNLLECSYEDLFKSKEYKKIIEGLDDEGIDILCRNCQWTKKKTPYIKRKLNEMGVLSKLYKATKIPIVQKAYTTYRNYKNRRNLKWE